MQSAYQPLDVLADELGAAAGRIERELRLQDEARAARFEARLVAIELAAFKAEEDRERRFQTRLAEIRDGRDGKDGEPGKDADLTPVLELVDGIERKHRSFLDSLEADLTGRIDAKLAEVKDGKDGRDGIDGKDADIAPIEEAISQRFASLMHDYSDWVESANGRVDAKLAEVKDGKDGAPGKDADDQLIIEALDEEFTRKFAGLEDEIEQRLIQVKDGKDGQPGKDGKDGEPGKDGKLPIAREWTNRVHYEGDVVRHNGATYQALADTGREPPHSDWGVLASRGTDGIGFVLRGTYDASAEYKQHDIVMINRNSFAAKYDGPGECPGDGWQLFGPSGQRGKEGPPGLKGSDGRSVSIAKLEADPDAMVLRITDSLGKTFELDIHPIAERIVEAAR